MKLDNSVLDYVDMLIDNPFEIVKQDDLMFISSDVKESLEELVYYVNKYNVGNNMIYFDHYINSYERGAVVAETMLDIISRINFLLSINSEDLEKSFRDGFAKEMGNHSSLDSKVSFLKIQLNRYENWKPNSSSGIFGVLTALESKVSFSKDFTSLVKPLQKNFEEFIIKFVNCVVDSIYKHLDILLYDGVEIDPNSSKAVLVCQFELLGIIKQYRDEGLSEYAIGRLISELTMNQVSQVSASRIINRIKNEPEAIKTAMEVAQERLKKLKLLK